MKLLLENKANPNMSCGIQHTSIFHLLVLSPVITNETFEIYLKLLLDYGADINATDCNLNTSLNYALCREDFDKATILLKYR